MHKILVKYIQVGMNYAGVSTPVKLHYVLGITDEENAYIVAFI